MQHGIIAGGFVLAEIEKKIIQDSNLATNDTDVYMTLEQFQEFGKAFDTLIENYPSEACKHHKTMHYIYSGLANNPQKIMYHIKLTIFFGVRRSFVIDIIVSLDAKKTISNFDLSFCKVSASCVSKKASVPLTMDAKDIPLFDLTEFKVKFGDSDDEVKELFNRSGTMSEPFTREYFDGNSTTRNRVEKYVKRGYTISIPTLPGVLCLKLGKRSKNYKTLLGNRSELSSGSKHIRSVMHLVANNCPIGWIAKNYEETNDFAKILVPYIKKIPHIKEDWDDATLDIQLKNKILALEANPLPSSLSY